MACASTVEPVEMLAQEIMHVEQQCQVSWGCARLVLTVCCTTSFFCVVTVPLLLIATSWYGLVRGATILGIKPGLFNATCSPVLCWCGGWSSCQGMQSTSLAESRSHTQPHHTRAVWRQSHRGMLWSCKLASHSTARLKSPLHHGPCDDRSRQRKDAFFREIAGQSHKWSVPRARRTYARRPFPTFQSCGCTVDENRFQLPLCLFAVGRCQPSAKHWTLHELFLSRNFYQMIGLLAS